MASLLRRTNGQRKSGKSDKEKVTLRAVNPSEARTNELMAKVFGYLDQASQLASQVTVAGLKVLPSGLVGDPDTLPELPSKLKKATMTYIEDATEQILDLGSDVLLGTAEKIDAVVDSTPDAWKDNALALQKQATKAATVAQETVESFMDEKTVAALKKKASSLQETATKAGWDGLKSVRTGAILSKPIELGVVASDKVFALKDQAVDAVLFVWSEILFYAILAGVGVIVACESIVEFMQSIVQSLWESYKKFVWLSWETFKQLINKVFGQLQQMMSGKTEGRDTACDKLTTAVAGGIQYLKSPSPRELEEMQDKQRKSHVGSFISDVGKFIKNYSPLSQREGDLKNGADTKSESTEGDRIVQDTG